jgi:hypothetical protein
MKMGLIQNTIENIEDGDYISRSQVFIKGEYEGLTPSRYV